MQAVPLTELIKFSPMYSHHSIKRTGSIKQPGLEFFKKSPLNVMCDPNLLTQQLIVLSLLNDLI